VTSEGIRGGRKHAFWVLQGVVVGSMMIACDECNQWYHGECVGVLELEAQALQYWTCDECRMREQLKGVQVDITCSSAGTLASHAAITLSICRRR
jgi:hypothetical protein